MGSNHTGVTLTKLHHIWYVDFVKNLRLIFNHLNPHVHPLSPLPVSRLLRAPYSHALRFAFSSSLTPLCFTFSSSPLLCFASFAWPHSPCSLFCVFYVPPFSPALCFASFTCPYSHPFSVLHLSSSCVTALLYVPCSLLSSLSYVSLRSSLTSSWFATSCTQA